MIKYPSLVGENHIEDQHKVLVKYQHFQVLEKIDGSNIQFRFDKNGFKIFGRNTENPDFKGFNQVCTPAFLEKVKGELEFVYLCEKNSEAVVCLFGEYFGRGINNRIDYGLEHRFIAFYQWFVGQIIDEGGESHRVIGRFSPTNWTTFSRSTVWDERLYNVPFIHTANIKSIEELKTFKAQILESQPSDGTREGYVLRPCISFDYDSATSQPFPVIKLRYPEFLEGAIRELKKEEHEVHELRSVVEGMVTSNRLINLFSKLGIQKIENQQIGVLIKEMLQDIKTEFDKQYPTIELELPKDEYKRLLNVAKEVGRLVKETKEEQAYETT